MSSTNENNNALAKVESVSYENKISRVWKSPEINDLKIKGTSAVPGTGDDNSGTAFFSSF